MDQKDFGDVRLARPVGITDLWDIDDRINRLEDCVERLEKCIEVLVLLYKEERVKGWELILKEMLEKKERKKGGHIISPIFKMDFDLNEQWENF
jgi:hypothetical protein